MMRALLVEIEALQRAAAPGGVLRVGLDEALDLARRPDLPRAASRLVNLLPESPPDTCRRLNLVLGRLFLDLDQPDRALHHLEVARSMDPGKAELTGLIARAALRKVETEPGTAALKLLDAVRSVDREGAPVALRSAYHLAAGRVLAVLSAASLRTTLPAFGSRFVRARVASAVLLGILSFGATWTILGTPLGLAASLVLPWLAVTLLGLLWEVLAGRPFRPGWVLRATLWGAASGLVLAALPVALAAAGAWAGISWARFAGAAFLQLGTAVGSGAAWGTASASREEFELALRFAQDAVVTDPADAAGWAACTRAMEALGETRLGLRVLQEARAHSARADFHLALARLWLERGKVPAADRALRRAAVGSFRSVDTLGEIARLEESRGRTEEAIEIRLQQVAMAPELAEPYRALGASYLARGQGEAAAEALRQALFLDPGNGSAVDLLVEACSLCGREVEALRHLEGLEAQGQHRLLVRKLRARLLRRFPYLRAERFTGGPAAEIRRSFREWEPGDVLLDRYEIDRVMRGGMGAVYLVRDLRLGTRYAAKTVLHGFLGEDEVVRRMIREAETWIDLERHPNVVSAEFIQRIDGRLVLFLEFVEGGDLSELLRRRRLSLEEGLAMGIQIARGMQHAWQTRGLVHRDLKPANLLRSRHGLLKITDFGIARTSAWTDEGGAPSDPAGATDAALTQAGAMMGTPMYMAPEQFADSSSVGTAADLYSFGIIVFEMLCGASPIQAENRRSALSWMAAHAGQAPTDPWSLNADIPQGVRLLLLRCLEKEPTSRHASFSEVSSLLEEEYQQLTGRPYQAPAAPRVEEVHYWNNRGVSQMTLGRQERADAAFTAALEREPEFASAWANLAVARAAGEDAARPLQALQRALELDASLGTAWTNLAVLHLRAERMPEAAAAIERALEAAPDGAASWMVAGSVHLRFGRYSRALEAFERAAQLDPAQARALSGMGVALHLAGRSSEALQALDKSLAMDSAEAAAWYNRGVVLLDTGNLQKALESVSRALVLAPDSGPARALHGLLMEAYGNRAEAQRSYAAARELGPGAAARKAVQAAQERLAAPT